MSSRSLWACFIRRLVAPVVQVRLFARPGVKQQTYLDQRHRCLLFHLIRGQRGSKRPFSFLGNRCKAVSDCRAGEESRSKYGTEASKTTDSSPWQQAKSRGAKVLKVHEQEQQQLEVRERAGDQQAAEVLQKADCDPTNWAICHGHLWGAANSFQVSKQFEN